MLTTAGQKGYFWCLSQTSIPTSNERGSRIKKTNKKINSKSEPHPTPNAPTEETAIVAGPLNLTGQRSCVVPPVWKVVS